MVVHPYFDLLYFVCILCLMINYFLVIILMNKKKTKVMIIINLGFFLFDKTDLFVFFALLIDWWMNTRKKTKPKKSELSRTQKKIWPFWNKQTNRSKSTGYIQEITDYWMCHSNSTMLICPALLLLLFSFVHTYYIYTNNKKRNTRYLWPWNDLMII